MANITLICCVGALAMFLVVVSVLARFGRQNDEKHRRLEGIEARKAEAEKKPRRTMKAAFADMMERQRKHARTSKADAQPRSQKTSTMQKQLDLLDVPMTSVTFLLVRLICGVFLACVAAIVCLVLHVNASISLLVGLVGLMVGVVAPSFVIGKMAKARQNNLRMALPDTMDLLVVSVEAGLGFDAAITRLYESDKSPLMEELMGAIRDVQHGVSRKEAYESMAKKCDVKEITSFTNALLQSEQLGISVKSVLSSQADSLRESRRRQAEEKALKAPVTMMIPMVLFIFPVILIVLLGPAAMNLMELFA